MDDIITLESYHGTTKHCADNIRKNGFRISKKTNEWLGFGVYFFYDRADAEYWSKACQHKNTEQPTTPTVLCATLSCSNDEYADLNNPEMMDKLELYCDTVFSDAHSNGKGMPYFNTKEERMCFWCNLWKMQCNIHILSYAYQRCGHNICGFPKRSMQYCVSSNRGIALHE